MSCKNSISILSLTRFHFFKLAEGLCEDYDVQVLSGWPDFQIAKYHPEIRHLHRSLPMSGFIKSINLKTVQSKTVDRYVNNLFSKGAARHIINPKLIIAASGQGYETFQESPNSIRVTDHASLDPNFERKILDCEMEKYGFQSAGNEKNSWRINRIYRDLKSADYLNVCSDLARKTFLDSGIDRSKILLNKFSVDTRMFFSSNQHFGNRNSSEKIRILFVGASIPRKGLHRLIHALCDAGSRRFNLKCVGALPTDPVLQEIFAKARSSGLNIESVPPVPEQQLVNFYHQADIFCLPSICDGWGLVTNQALASGLPVLISKYAGSSELVTQDNGQIIDPLNHDAMVDTFKSLTLDKIKEMAPSIRGGSVSEDWSTYCERYNSNIKRIL
jgi:glycosyltransferase involved in cell wall biosynthesis